MYVNLHKLKSIKLHSNCIFPSNVIDFTILELQSTFHIKNETTLVWTKLSTLIFMHL